MSSIDKLAEMFRERNNPDTINVTTGKVIAINPLKVQWGDSIFLESDRLIIGASIINVMSEGDQVIMIPNNDYSKWYLIDKVG